MFSLPGRIVATAAAASLALALCSPTLHAGGRSGFGGLIPDDEPANNTRDGVAPMPITGFRTRIGILSLTPGDVDIVKVFMFRGDVLTAVTTPLSGPPGAPFRDPNTRLTVMDAAGIVQTTNDNAGSDVPTDTQIHGSVVRYQATADDVVAVQVTGSNAAQSGQYLLMISLTGASDGDIGEPEPSETTAQALVLGMPVCGPISAEFNFGVNANVDFMALDMKRGDVLTATSTPLNGAGFVTPDTVMTLFDSDGVTRLTVNDDDDVEDLQGTSLGSTIRFMAGHTGRYFIRMESFEHATEGAYEMTMCIVPRSANTCPADLNGDGAVGSSDLSLLLGMWGGCP